VDVYRAVPSLLLGGLALPALASAGASDDALPEVVVTAQFQEQNLQETPLSISAIDGAALRERSFVNIMDTAAALPNVTMTPAGAGAGIHLIYIKSHALEPRVGFYVDEVYHPTLVGSTFDLLDVERVEVLRGPQGTLFGRNSVGGAVSLFTTRPRGDDSGYVEVTGGAFDRLDVKGAVDLGLVDERLMLRIAGGRQSSDGYVERRNFPCLYPALAGSLPAAGRAGDCGVGTLGSIDLSHARVTLRGVARDDLENTISVDYLDDRGSPVGAPLLELTLLNPMAPPNTPSGLALWLATVGVPRYGLSTSPQLLDALMPDDPSVSYAIYGNPGASRPQRAFVNPPRNGLRSWGASNVLEWRPTGSLALKSITAYREYDAVASGSVAAFPLQETHFENTQRQFSQEIRLSGTAFDERLDWAAGAFYFDTSNRGTGRVQTEGFSIFLPGPGLALPFVLDTNVDDRADFENLSVFAHAIWHAGSKLDVTLGARYSSETKDYRYFRQPVGAAPENTTASSNRYSRLTPKVALGYSLTPDVLAYASYSTGFTAGGFNPRPFTAADSLLTYGPEVATTWELGLKSEWLDHRLRANGSAFFTQFDDIQMQLAGCAVGCPTRSPVYYDNAGDAEIRGFELELEAQLPAGFSLSAFVGHMDFEFVRLDPQAGTFPDGVPPKVPGWKTGVSLWQSLDLGRAGGLTTRVDVVNQSSGYGENARAAAGYTLLNARMAWESAARDWSLALAGTNLTGQRYYFNFTSQLAAYGLASGQLAPPRSWALTLGYRF
jgi:iron complex outermembrane receptor protein